MIRLFGPDKSDSDRTSGERQAVASSPSISLPKGGGAIRGMGEKFAANPVTGTGSMTVPIATSPGRSGFSPQLALSYDSGAGNGPYGFGWSLSLPSITRKTDKGLPRYEDADESDVFILSGAEDLVPVFKTDTITGEFAKDAKGDFVYDEFPRDGYLVRRYRPRIEGLFARIERWTRQNGGNVYWRSISKDNITTLYGKTDESRIANPEDPSQIFSWLICQSYDDKGNAIVYKYKAENSDSIDLSQVHEKNRTSLGRSANRHPKNILYGNSAPNRDADWNVTDPAQLPDSTWMFEIVFDYEDGHYREQQPDANKRIFAQALIDLPSGSHWPVRQDPFSSFRAGFEVRTYRLCRRVLMFHHFPDELGTADYLVRSTEFAFSASPIASFITEATQSGYVRQADGSYLKKSLPPLSFEYSKAEISDDIETIDAESLKNLPVGANGLQYQWLDLDGEGLQCVLAEQEGGWYYKRNVSPISTVRENGKDKLVARFESLIKVTTGPSTAEVGSARNQFLDLAGDGNLDVVQLEKPVAGFFERTEDERWESFIPFASAPNLQWNDPNLRFVDLTGDGHADILITEDEALTWYPSLAEKGFGAGIRMPTPIDEEKGPAVVFADAAQAIFAADLSGDGLTDIVRMRNGEVCYWPNLGYGRFGAKVTMDNAPWFDAPDQFDPKRIRLADIDGSGTTDIIYLERNRVAVYRNECGNGWSSSEYVTSFPAVDDLSSVTAVDLLGNGTACLVWSSALPGNGQRQMRYIALMEEKPHLLVGVKNNIGAQTVVQYAPSTRFYLQDKLDGKPWLTRLPFPMHVVERAETHDLISRNRFVTRYAYHHGYFDGNEREFRGFGMVEQWDTEEIGALKAGGTLPDASNIEESSYVPPAYTKTWFHTGAHIEGERISRYFEDEYYREGDESEGVSGLSTQQLEAMLLPDTELPATLKRKDGSSTPWELTAEEIREACRALKGAVLRREIYARDGTDDEDRPYSATEQNYTIELLQPQGEERHAVFFAHPRESIDFHYERKLVQVSGSTVADPRAAHTLTLDVDGYGNALKSVAIGYGRRLGLSPLQGEDKNKQEQIHVTYTENQLSNAIEEPDAYRAPLACEVRTFELIELPSLVPASNQPEITNLFRFDEMLSKTRSASDGQHDLAYENSKAVGALPNQTYRRLIEWVRTLYRRDDLTGLLPPGVLQSLALLGESYKLAFTPGLLAQVFQRNGQALLPSPAAILGGQGVDQGGYVDPDGSGHWWIPSGKVFFDVHANITNPSLTAPSELAEARAHFFLPRKFADPFDQSVTVDYETPHDLLVIRTEDALQNTVEATNNYRTLQPRLITDPNGNRSEAAFDALGMVVATAVKGKVNQNLGDLLEEFEADPALKGLQDFFADPAAQAASLLGKSTARIVYDLDRFMRCGQPPFASSLARETHFLDQGGEQTRIQINFSYSDGFGREIQKKIQAEGGDAPKREAPVQLPSRDICPGALVRDAQGNLVQANASHRWGGKGRTVFNNGGKAVKQYEPFFSSTHLYEDEREMTDMGVSPILFYDPVERVVATLHPNHTYEKVVFDPWQQTTHDVNDTVTFQPSIDDDVKEFFRRLPEADYVPTWFGLRVDPAHAAEAALKWPDPKIRTAEKKAAEKTAKHADTPAVAHFDSLGRPFLTIAHNKFERRKPNNTIEIVEEQYSARVGLDIQGNQREVRDAVEQASDPLGRVVMRYHYDMVGNRVYQASMEAGERWMLGDVAGKPIRAWDSRGHAFRTEYDRLRRPLRTFVQGADPQHPVDEILFEKKEYGEGQPNELHLNLRTNLFRQSDSAGLATSEAYDFKGNLLRSSRRLAQDYKTPPNWSAHPGLEQETFTSSTTYDALNRPSQLIAPHSTQPGAKRNVIQPAYNEAGLLERVDVWLGRPIEPAGLLNAETVPSSHAGVNNIDYNARGQRLRIEYKNGATTRYAYDPETFRLVHLYTRRGATFTGDCENPDPPPPATVAAPDVLSPDKPCGLQNLHYTYDPAGNITHIHDDAQQTIYFRNKRVEPSADYNYDAIYRLIDATGREHLGQLGGSPIPHSHNDAPRVGIDWSSNDGKAMGTYLEHYVYDAVGNLVSMQHSGLDPANLGWSRSYAYHEPSLIEPAKHCNRLSSTTVGANSPELYSYDAPGNMTAVPHLTLMRWDFKNQLSATSQQVVVNGEPQTTYYVYDGTGQRLRKVTVRQAVEGQTATRMRERIYVGGFEIYREYENDGDTMTLERETLHIMDDQQRIALVETKTFEVASPPTALASLIRYQFGNHLGSASLELDHEAQIISYEEYAPYGSTSYQAVRSQTETRKRYRYTGMERDEESGLEYHAARYYSPWFGRWLSADPIGIEGGLNLYEYCKNNPVIFSDITGNDIRGRIGKCEKEDLIPRLDMAAAPLDPDYLEKWAQLREKEEDQLQMGEEGGQLVQFTIRGGRAATKREMNKYRDPERLIATLKAGGMVVVPEIYFPASSIYHSASSIYHSVRGEPDKAVTDLVTAAIDLGGALAGMYIGRLGRAAKTEAASATDDLAATVKRTLSKNERGPVVATASSETGFSLRLNQAEHEELPALLQDRVNASEALSAGSPSEILGYQKTSGIFNHADVNAVGAQWKAIEAKLGKSITLDEARRMITIDVVSTSTGSGVSLCSRCSFILEGFQTTSRVQQAFEEQMLRLWKDLYPKGKPI